MGIRFACHACDKHLNIKRELAGRRGICPSCSARFRIPTEDCEKSVPLVDAAAGPARQNGNGAASDSHAMGNRQDSHRSGQHAGVGQSGTSAVATVPQTGNQGSGSQESGNHGTGSHKSGTPSTPNRTVPSALVDQDEAVWYVRPPSGGQYGPADTEVLRQWIDEGRVAASALLWRDGWPQWRQASEVLVEIASQLPEGKTSPANPLGRELGRRDSSESKSETPSFTGRGDLGAQKSNRTSRRILAIGLLAALVIGLFIALVAAYR